MVAATTDSTFSQRLCEIQASWSPVQRRHRALQGRRLRQQLIRLVGLSTPEPEIWAGGATAVADLERLAGQSSVEARECAIIG